MKKNNKKGLSIISVESLCKDYFMEWMEGEREDKIQVLERLKVGQGVPVVNSRYNISYDDKKISDVQFFNTQVRLYQNAGLDLGKGNSEFGYKMPLQEYDRELIIFRRR